MTRQYAGSILMLSLHGYVSAEPELGKPDTGGQVVFVLELAKRFSRLGYRVDVVTRKFEGQPAVDSIHEGLRVWRIPFAGSDFVRKEDMHDHVSEFITNFLFEAKTDALHYDVVNSHYWDAGWAGQRIAEELQIPHIHTPHSLGKWKLLGMKGAADNLEEKYRFEERIRKEFLIYRNCDQVIATTQQQVELLGEDYSIPEDHITRIPPGIDETRYTPVPGDQLESIRKRLKISENDVYTVGRAASNKGYGLLIKALPTLRQLSPKTKLQLAVGANSDRDKRLIKKLKEQAKDLDVAKHIRWRGYISDDDMADHYRAAGVFALPSRYEPFGMTAVEAMACGTPSVVTTRGGLHEVIDYGTHALFADPKRPVEYATALSMPIRYPQLREKLSIEGARYARRQYGWTGIAKRTVAVFDRFKGRYAELREDEGEADLS
jgi:mannosylfructose-phosphate synthase